MASSEDWKITLPRNVVQSLKHKVTLDKRNGLNIEFAEQMNSINIWFIRLGNLNHFALKNLTEFEHKQLKTALLRKLTKKLERVRKRILAESYAHILDEIKRDVNPLEEAIKLLSGKTVFPEAPANLSCEVVQLDTGKKVDKPRLESKVAEPPSCGLSPFIAKQRVVWEKDFRDGNVDERNLDEVLKRAYTVGQLMECLRDMNPDLPVLLGIGESFSEGSMAVSECYLVDTYETEHCDINGTRAKEVRLEGARLEIWQEYKNSFLET